MTTSSLIDILLLTPEKISDSSAIDTGISDHSLVFALRKISVIDKQENILQIRNIKNFNEEKFIEDLLKQTWEHIFLCKRSKCHVGNISRCPRQTAPVISDSLTLLFKPGYYFIFLT